MKQIVGIIEVENGFPVRLDSAGTEVEFRVDPYLLSDGVSLEAPLPVTFTDQNYYVDTAGNLRGVWPVKMASFNPSSLFADGQQGHWSGGYDPALGHLWQDSTGLTPVTAPGQPVGLVLDKSQGVVMGPEMRGEGYGASVGTPPLAPDYSPQTGAGITSRGTGSANASGVFIDGLTVGQTYLIDIENTGNNTVSLRSANLGGSGYGTVSRVSRASIYVSALNPRLAVAPAADDQNSSFILHTVRHVPGNHARQPTALSRPTLARWPKGGRRNLLTWSDDLTNAVWLKTASVTALGGGAFEVTASAANQLMRQFVNTVISDTVTATASAEFRAVPGGAESARISVLFSGTGDGVASELVPLTNEWVRHEVSSSSASGDRRELRIVSTQAGAFQVRRPQLEVGLEATPYQRVTTQYDITEAGVPDVWHLSNDGGDSLPITLPADTYGRARVNAAGLVTVDTVVDPANALVSNQQVDVILRQGAFTSEEEANIRTYWARYAA